MKSVSISALALVIGLTMPAPLNAQGNPFFGGEGLTSSSSQSGGDSWQGIKLNPKTKIKLDFRNANVDLVISMFQKTSGVTIVKDPSLTGAITLTSATSVPLKTGFQILEKTLNLKGYDLRKDGELLVIQKQQQRGGRDQGNSNPFGGGFPIDFGNQSQSNLKFYPIKYANATQVARLVNEVFQGAGQQQNPFQQMFGGGGGGGRFQFGNRGGQNNNPFARLMGGQQGSNIRASADDYSNSVIVNAPDKEQKEVERVIKAIDKETDQPQRTKVYALKYATAQEVAATIQNVLTNNAPRGKGGVTSSGTNFQDRMQQAARFGSTQAAFGTVAADARTNSLIVTATEESQLIVDAVIKDLDKAVEFENTTFVFPLNNAKADDIANLINQSFGQRQGTNRNNRTTTPTQQRQTNQNQNRNQTQNRGLGGNNTTEDPNSLYLDMQDENATSGELLTSVTTQGGFQFGGGGGQFRQGQSQQNQTQTGRSADGRLVPVRDLTGQITAIPDPNTNSIIIVANPDYAALVKQILEQLDRIPEQVMIETLIVEANLDNTDKLGIEWNYLDKGHLGVSGQNGNVGTTFGIANNTTSPATGFKYTIGGKNLTSFLNAIQTDSKFNILSTPRIFTSNNTQAQINISQSIPYVVSSRIDNNGNTLFNYSFTDVGIVLTVTPRITANGYVTMDINQTANDLQSFTDFGAPIVNQREADTVVSVKNGETVILGGIIRNSISSTTNKVPILGDIPLLGKLFQSTSKEKHKTELMVLLTPRIVKDEDEARQLRIDGTKQLSPETQKELGKVIPPENTKSEIIDQSKVKKNGGN